MDDLKSDVGGVFGNMFGGIQEMLNNTFGGLFGRPEQPKATDPGAPNTGTGRDGTFGEGTYGQGRPSDGANVSAPGERLELDRQNLVMIMVQCMQGIVIHSLEAMKTSRR